ncbi:MAG: capsule biosynthesis protein [Nocardioidaceae bacterium]|nr:capsule biosynthesis protein [Nocardioidaceae bacterium]
MLRRPFGTAMPPGPATTGRRWLELLGGSPRWRSARAAAAGPRVLVATNLGGFQQGTVLESLLAVALTLRAAQVEFLLCDADLPACQLTKVAKISPRRVARVGTRPLCGTCVASGREAYAPLGLKVRHLGDQLAADDRRALHARVLSADLGSETDVEALAVAGVPVREHAWAGALRYYGRGDLAGERYGDAILRHYLEAAMLTALSTRRLLDKEQYDVVVFHHGIYVPQGIIGDICRDMGVRVVNSNPAYRKQTWIFSHGDTYHKTMIAEPNQRWLERGWTTTQDRELETYLASRRSGVGDWIHFNKEPVEASAAVLKNTGLQPGKPIIGLLSNVVWDAQLHYGANAFPDMLAWVMHTIRWFQARPGLQLLIRVHPAEVTGLVPSRQPLLSEIRSAFPTLPPNVAVIPPESKVSTYAAMDLCDTVLIYNTKAGIELAAAGIPVVVAGEAWIRGKGFSTDVTTVRGYEDVLSSFPRNSRMSAAEVELARRYAYHFFFRRMIPLPLIVSPAQFQFDLEVQDLAQLEPGSTPGLDIICDGILSNSPFEFSSGELRGEDLAS